MMHCKRLKINDNMFSVPDDVTRSVFKVLPRLLQEARTFKVELKRRLQYESLPLSFNVGPHKVFLATSWLSNARPLLREEEIIPD